jgi:two-component system NtrC family response regulator
VVEARRRLQGRAFDAILLDMHLPDGNGLELLQELSDCGDEASVIILSGDAQLDAAIQALRLSAYDLMLKPCKISDLEQRLHRIARGHLLENENLALRRQLRTRRIHSMELVGNSPGLTEIRRIIARAAPTDAAILIQGETGTGKEVAAHLIHANSARKDAPFVPVNCAALPREQADSELFGHRKGAFAGADTDHRGMVQTAAGGTLFLDEVGDLPLNVQAKFLRLLESKEGRRAGDSEPYHVDVRVIAATHCDLRREVAAGKFREDLFYRLATFELKMPCLRNIPDDLPSIARYLLNDVDVSAHKARRFSAAALGAMRWYAWPGNVRELRNVIERAKILCDGEEIGPEHLNLPATSHATHSTGAPTTLAEMEWGMIQNALRAQGGNKTAAARSLGISLRTLYNKLEAKAAPAEETSPGAVPGDVTTAAASH